MTTVTEFLTERAKRMRDEPFFTLEIPTSALEWLCSAAPSRLAADDHRALLELNLVTESGNLTPAGEFARSVTTRSDRELVIVRTQRGDRLRTLEFFLGDEIAFTVDDSASPTGVHTFGYVFVSDLVNAAARWLALLPVAASPEADVIVSLADLATRAKAPDGDITLITVAIESMTLFDAAFVDGVGYAYLGAADSSAQSTDLTESRGDLGHVDARVSMTFVSAFNLYLMLADALVRGEQ